MQLGKDSINGISQHTPSRAPQRGQSVPRAAVSSSLATERVGERARRACAPGAGDGFTAPGASAAACVHATMRSSLSFISSAPRTCCFQGRIVGSFLAPHCPHYEERDSGAMQVSKEKQLEFNLAVLKRRDQGITNVRGWP